MRPNGNAVANRATQYLLHRIFLTFFQVQCASKPLDQRHRAGLCALSGEFRFFRSSN
jgi:hypothetical protein